VAVSALIFDLDDTLYPELEYILAGFRAAALAVEARWGWWHYPIEKTYRELQQALRESSDAHVFDEWVERERAARQMPLTAVAPLGAVSSGAASPPVASPELPLPGDSLPGAAELMLAAYRACRPELHLFADAAWALDSLGREYRLGLLTDGRSESQRYKLEALGIAGMFQEVLVTDEMGLDWRKPSERGFEWLLDRFDCSPEDAVYVGDNPAKDFAAPRSLGMGSVRVRRPCGRHRMVEAPRAEAAAAVEIGSLFEIREALALLREQPAPYQMRGTRRQRTRPAYSG
jgi:putative hydrolase of the HAD superfamily